MVSTRKKGDSAELKIKSKFEELGFNVIRSPRTFRQIFINSSRKYISKDNDFFNLFDLICKSKESTLWIQVKSTPSDASKVKPAITEFASLYGSPSDKFLIYVVERKRIYYYELDGDVWRRHN